MADLAEYVSKVDQAKIPNPKQMKDSLYGILKAHERITGENRGRKLTDSELLEVQMRVVDAAVYLAEKHSGKNFSIIFQSEPGWFSEKKQLIETDLACYHEDLKQGHIYKAGINGVSEPVTGLWLDHPKSIFFRIWAWSDTDTPNGKGYQFLALDFSTEKKNRFVIGVDPESGTNLKGLGEHMEKHESERRKKLGKERPVHPKRYPADNSDPWYFGQGHGYTVIDSPGQGTVLTAEEVQEIHKKWMP